MRDDPQRFATSARPRMTSTPEAIGRAFPMSGLERIATGTLSSPGAFTIDAMPLEGRGTSYSRRRAVVEWVLLRAYRGGWPAGLVRAVGMQRRVRTETHAVRCPGWPAGIPP